MVAVGDPAPGFSLSGTDGAEHRTYTLEEFRGRPVVLVFYPGDATPVCTRQLNAYTADIEQFDEVDAQILALSPQGLASHDEFADAQGGFSFPLLVDEDKAVGQSYGILGPLGFYRRSVFVIAADGTVAYVHRALAGLTFRPTEELVSAIAGANGGS